MSKEQVNERILNVVGEQNYKMYMIITDGKEVNSILDSSNPMFELYEYRDKLLNERIGQDISINILERLLTGDEDSRLRKQLENLFLESISNSKFKMIKDMLINHELGWNISRLMEVHRKNKGYRIFSILSIEYDNWIN